MAVAVAAGLFVKVALQSGIQVNPRLVGEAHHHPHHVGQFIGQIQLIARFARLVAVASRDYTRHLAHLLGKYRHIGEFAEVAHAVLLNPSVNTLLCFLYCHRATKVMLFLQEVNPAAVYF